MTLNISGQKFTIMTKLLEGKDDNRVSQLYAKLKEKCLDQEKLLDADGIMKLCDDYRYNHESELT